jgi:hypothetical protein
MATARTSMRSFSNVGNCCHEQIVEVKQSCLQMQANTWSFWVAGTFPIFAGDCWQLLVGYSVSLRANSCQVCFRVGRDTADLLNELASRQGGMRPLILGWLADAGYRDVAQRDLARPDGRRRQTLPAAESELATER